MTVDGDDVEDKEGNSSDDEGNYPQCTRCFKVTFSDPVAVCSRCQMAVHFSCYAMEKMGYEDEDDDDWLCDLCKLSDSELFPGKSKKCAICRICWTNDGLYPTPAAMVEMTLVHPLHLGRLGTDRNLTLTSLTQP